MIMTKEISDVGGAWTVSDKCITRDRHNGRACDADASRAPGKFFSFFFFLLYTY